MEAHPLPVTGTLDSDLVSNNASRMSYVEVVSPSFSRNVSSFGFGGGPSGGEVGGTPELPTSTTPPPSPSHEGAALVEGGLAVTSERVNESASDCSSVNTDSLMCELDKVSIPTSHFGTQTEFGTAEVGTQTDAHCVTSFSAKTCLELLGSLSAAQLDHECNYFKALGCDIPDFRLMRSSTTNTKFKSAAIQRHLDTILKSATCKDFATLTKKFVDFNNSVSPLVEDAQQDVDNMRLPAPVPVTVLTPEIEESTSSLEIQSSDTSGNELPLTESVCYFNNSVDFSDLSVEDILEQIPPTSFTQGSCGRRTAYFGTRPYSYAPIRHEPQEYPSCPALDIVLTKLKEVVPDFSTDDYTCLITHYPDGRSYIPTHSDDEPEIQADSTIFTISVGAARVLRFVNKVGLLREHDIEVPHGSLYCMSTASQGAWSHELLRDPSITKPRISFTFRLLVDRAPRVKHPIQKPPEPKPRLAMGSKNRILFLTDSILNRTPEHVFNRVAEHRCVKKTNYFLTDIFNFEEEFAYSEFVVFSCGVNDLSTTKDPEGHSPRPPMTGAVLGDMVSRRLADCCARYPDTYFVFNSVISTSHDWLNHQIGIFNKIMFELSLGVPNLRFFDSHEALIRGLKSGDVYHVIQRDDKRGTHLTFAARKLVSDQLVNGIELIVGRRAGSIKGSSVRGWSWPLREQFVAMHRAASASYRSPDVR